MKITHWEDLGSTPARVNRYTGEIQINDRYWINLNPNVRRYIIEHEKGHFLQDTRSEFDADNYAFSKVAGSSDKSLKDSVYSISQVLSFTNPEHKTRLINRIRLALQYDWEHNQNSKAKDALTILNQSFQNHYTMDHQNKLDFFEPSFGFSNYDEDDIYDNGAGKARRQAKREERKQRRTERKDQKKERRDLKNQRLSAKNDIKLARADAKRTKANAKMTLAEQGRSGSDWLGEAVSGVVGLFKKDGGAPADAVSQDPVTGAYLDATGAPISVNTKKKLLGMPMGVGIAVIIVVVLVVGFIAYKFIKKKK